MNAPSFDLILENFCFIFSGSRSIRRFREALLLRRLPWCIRPLAKWPSRSSRNGRSRRASPTGRTQRATRSRWTSVWLPTDEAFSRFVPFCLSIRNCCLKLPLIFSFFQVHINEKFAKLAESLYIADRKARESVELRAQLQKKQAQKEKEKKEETLRQLAQQVREERAGLRPTGGAGGSRDDDEEAMERDNLRQERHRDRQRERNLARAAPGDKK